MSTLCRRTGKSGRGEGANRRSVRFFPNADAGVQENILQTVTLRGALSFYGVGDNIVFCRECWSISEVHGFFVQIEEKRKEKKT